MSSLWIPMLAFCQKATVWRYTAFLLNAVSCNFNPSMTHTCIPSMWSFNVQLYILHVFVIDAIEHWFHQEFPAQRASNPGSISSSCMFDRDWSSAAVVTPAKYECYSRDNMKCSCMKRHTLINDTLATAIVTGYKWTHACHSSIL